MFISFEGLDCSGKDTQLLLFVDYLREKFKNKRIYVTRQPGGTSLGEKIRNLIFWDEEIITPKTEFLLYLADKCHHMEKINDALSKGEIVVSNRYHDSALAYQNNTNGFPFTVIDLFTSVVLQDCIPDITFFIDILPETFTKRLEEKNLNEKLDKIEQKGLDFFIQTRNNYLELASREPDRIKIIDGNKPIKEVFEQIKTITDILYGEFYDNN